MPDHSAFCAYVERDQLVVISEGYVTWWRTKSGHTLEQVGKSAHLPVMRACMMAPVINLESRLVYMMQSTGVCYSLHMSRATFREVGS